MKNNLLIPEEPRHEGNEVSELNRINSRPEVDPDEGLNLPIKFKGKVKIKKVDPQEQVEACKALFKELDNLFESYRRQK